MNQNDNQPPARPSSGNTFWVGILAGVVIAALLGGGAYMVLGKSSRLPIVPPTRTIAAAEKPEADPNAAANIDAEAAKLIGTPRTITLTTETARIAGKALAQGDYTTTQKIMEDGYAASHMRYGHFVPFNQLINQLPVKRNDDAMLARLNGWVEQYPKSEIPYIARGVYFLNTAAAFRGGNFINKVRHEDLKKFSDYSQRSVEDLNRAISLNGNDPLSYYYLVATLGNDGNSEALDEAFTQAIAKFPDYYSLYSIRLKSLEPKWGGSVQEMYDFTDSYAGKAADTSPVKLLYVQLYSDLLSTAGTACYNYEGKEEKKMCIESQMARLITPKLEKEVHDALNLYSKNDPYLFSTELGYILAELIQIQGGDVYRGAILQLAGDAMGSSNELVHDANIHNNFMLDQKTGDIWNAEQRYDNAERKYNEALNDVQWMKFPTEEDKDLTIGRIYESFAHLYSNSAQFPKAIAYAKAAKAVGDISSDLPCNDFYRMKNYTDAIRECTAHYDDSGDMTALFHRAQSYTVTGDDSDALKDDTILAESPGNYQSNGVINGSVIFGNRNDMPGMKDWLDAHPFVFDEKTQSDDTLMIAYNNRCYAEMHMGDLQPALDDCTMSLKHGSLPDAYQKQQELVKMLKQKN